MAKGFLALLLCAFMLLVSSVSTTSLLHARVSNASRIASHPSAPKALAFTTISSGSSHTCALTSAGNAYCWGLNNYGQIGDGTTQIRKTPVATSMPSGVTFTSIAAGADFTCALTAAGKAYCWGGNAFKQLGDTTQIQRNRPIPVIMPTGITFRSISAGIYHTCALTAAGKAYCWGLNDFGQVGDGTTTRPGKPKAVTMPSGVTFASMSANGTHTCARTSAGVGYCWGDNSSGQLGIGSLTNRTTPAKITMPSGVTFASIVSGGNHTCALTAAGKAYCWGKNEKGALGNGSTTNRLVPVAMTMPRGVAFASINLGMQHGCARATTSTVYCWGGNYYGNLGDGTTTDRKIPTLVTMPRGVTLQTIDMGYYFSCGRTSLGATYCWGNNTYAQLGDGTTINRTTPIAVRMP